MASFESWTDLSVFKFLFSQILVSAQKCQLVLFNSKCTKYVFARVNILPKTVHEGVCLHVCLHEAVSPLLPAPPLLPPHLQRDEGDLAAVRKASRPVYRVQSSVFACGLVFCQEHHTGYFEDVYLLSTFPEPTCELQPPAIVSSAEKWGMN